MLRSLALAVVVAHTVVAQTPAPPVRGEPVRGESARGKPAESSAAPAPAPKTRALLLRGATLHTMLPGDEPRVADLLIEDGHIRALGPAAASGSDHDVLELAGKHVVPGLIDAHVNFDPEHDALYLAAGVTLVRDLGGDHFTLTQQRLPEQRERVPGPALLTAGAALDGDPPASAAAVVLRNADAAESYLPILFEEQVDFLSVLPGLPDDAWRKTLALAKERGLPVFGARPARLALADALAAGQGGFHSLDSLLPPGKFWDAVTSDELAESIAALAQAGKPLVPLLHASAARLEDQDTPEWRALLGLFAPTYESWWRAELATRKPFLAPERRGAGELVLDKQTRALRALYDAGARLLAGSGSPQPWLVPGTALHQELAQWVAAGIPPDKVLELATRGAAEALGLAGQRGTLQPGAWADLLVLDQDPREDVARLREPAIVVVRGRALTRTELDERVRQVGLHQSALRTALDKPVDVAPPPQGEQGTLLLDGTVESDSYGVRVSTERYRVLRLDADTLLYTGRVVFPASAGSVARELTLEQFVRRGRLEQVHASLKQGESLLEHDGLWTANSWRMQTRLDGKVVNAPAPLREQPACVETGSVTTLLVLGQLPSTEKVSVVQLHPGFDAEPVNWRLELGEDGNHRVRTQVGYKAFHLDDVGAIEWAISKVGAGVLQTRALAGAAADGKGLPVPGGARASEAGSTPPKPGG